METMQLVVGIDVSKARLDWAVQGQADGGEVTNDETGCRTLLGRLAVLKPKLIVVEATGGLETLIVGSLAAVGLPVAVVNPRQVRDFAKASGRFAKTDTLDAQVLAHFGEAIKPPVRPLKDEDTQALTAWMVRRRQLVAMLTAEKNRLASASPPLRKDVQVHIRWLEKRLDGVNQGAVGCTEGQSPVVREGRLAGAGYAQSAPDCGVGRYLSVQSR